MRRVLVALGLVASIVVGSCSDANAPALAGPHASLLIDADTSAPGIFIPGVEPATCFVGFTSVTDADLDGTDDDCEYKWAKAFNPRLRIGIDQCPEREMFWAAKGFNGHVIRVAYLPSWWQDCGALGHHGDSELIMVEAYYNLTSHHWVFNQMWLSAHSGAPTDRSAWVDHEHTTFEDRDRGAPVVWIAENKHGNYQSAGTCAFIDNCQTWSLYARDSIHQNRNVGSRFQDILSPTCVYMRPGINRCESFYTGKPFNGWFADPPVWNGFYFDTTHGATPYRDVLMSNKYETRVDQWGTEDHGFTAYGGPASPPPTWSATIIGPALAGVNDGCSFYVQTNIPDAEYYQWTRDGTPIGNLSSTSVDAGGSTDFELSVSVWGPSGGSADSHSVTVSSAINGCEGTVRLGVRPDRLQRAPANIGTSPPPLRKRP